MHQGAPFDLFILRSSTSGDRCPPSVARAVFHPICPSVQSSSKLLIRLRVKFGSATCGMAAVRNTLSRWDERST